MKSRVLLFLSIVLGLNAQAQDSAMMQKISDDILMNGTSYENLRTLCKTVGHRISGSPAAAKAVLWGQAALTKAGADRVWLQPVDVPHWVRGKEELKLSIGDKNSYVTVPMLSLGNSEGTLGKKIEAPIVMVNNFEEFKALKDEQVKGKVLFFNYRFRQDLLNTFHGYGDAVKYRWMTPVPSATKGAIAVIIRSVSTGVDDLPHTGTTKYVDSVKHIPAVAIGNTTADKLEAKCKKGSVNAQLISECKMDGMVRSYNVIGEIKGSEHPEQIIVVGGHLDSWDVGEGAHDDGAGCVQSIEVIRTLKALHIQPKRTIRAVLFMNEENGMKGGLAYHDSALAQKEKHILAIESDAGGFSPRGFGMEMAPEKKKIIQQYIPLFMPYGIYDFSQEEGGVDIGPLAKQGVPLMGLLPDPQRYFDIHHTNGDVFEAVNHRELKIGAVAMTGLAYLISEYGL